MGDPWIFLSDQSIWNALKDPTRSIDEDFTRFMCIELLSRIRRLEAENHTLRLLVQEFNEVEDKQYQEILQTVREFLTQQDEDKSTEVDFYKQSGISFVEWVNLFSRGSFS